LQSMRLCADAEIANHNTKERNLSGRHMQFSLLVAQGLHRIEARSAACRV
jgi:hypothetical protein